MSDFLDTFFGKKKGKANKKSLKPKRSGGKAVGYVLVKGRNRRVYKGKSGGLYMRKSGRKVYVPKSKVSKRKRKGKSPKRKGKSPKKAKKAKKAKKSPKRNRFGQYGLGQPDLMNMMGPADLKVSLTQDKTFAPSSKAEMNFGKHHDRFGKLYDRFGVRSSIL